MEIGGYDDEREVLIKTCLPYNDTKDKKFLPVFLEITIEGEK